MVGEVSVVAVFSPFFLTGLTVWLLDAVGRSVWRYVRTGHVPATQARNLMVKALLAFGLYVVWIVLAQVIGAAPHVLERLWLAPN